MWLLRLLLQNIVFLDTREYRHCFISVFYDKKVIAYVEENKAHDIIVVKTMIITKQFCSL